VWVSSTRTRTSFELAAKRLSAIFDYISGKEELKNNKELFDNLASLIAITELKDLTEKIGDDGFRLKYVRGLMDDDDNDVSKREWFKKYEGPDKMPWALKYLYDEAVKTQEKDKEKATMMYKQVGCYLAELEAFKLLLHGAARHV